jgi:serine/threonine-protein kinase RsbT
MGSNGTAVSEETCIAIRLDADIVVACQKGRALAAEADFSANDQVVVVIAISEVARNILKYAGNGQVRLSPVRQSGRVGLVVVAQDDGPGIANIEQALQDGFSTGQSLGLGLPGAKRLMDEFEIVSAVGQGTTVTLTKWKK